ncbi:uncharacterized protein LOC144767639 [Lissotriton helveticus]
MFMITAYEQGEIWWDNVRAVRSARSAGVPRRWLRNMQKRWEDIRCCTRRITQVQLKQEPPRQHGGHRHLTPHMLRVQTSIGSCRRDSSKEGGSDCGVTLGVSIINRNWRRQQQGPRIGYQPQCHQRGGVGGSQWHGGCGESVCGPVGRRNI